MFLSSFSLFLFANISNAQTVVSSIISNMNPSSQIISGTTSTSTNKTNLQTWLDKYLNNLLNNLYSKNNSQTQTQLCNGVQIPITQTCTPAQQTNPFLNNPYYSPYSPFGMRGVSPLGGGSGAGGGMRGNGGGLGNQGGNQGQQRYQAGPPYVAPQQAPQQPPADPLKEYSGSYSNDYKGNFAPASCGMPQGPMAYNIGTDKDEKTKIPKICLNGSANKSETVFAGFEASTAEIIKSGKYAGGYINVLVEKDLRSTYGGVPANNGYDENKFTSYSNSDALRYIDHQIDHWLVNANPPKGDNKKRCIVVDVDNCDQIPDTEYRKVLDRIKQKSDQNPGAEIKVFLKNPQQKKCSQFMNHPVVVGFFVEEIDNPKTVSDLRKEAKAENKPILFARGGQGKDSNLDKYFAQAQRGQLGPNIAISKDNDGKEGEYGCVNGTAFYGGSSAGPAAVK